MLRPGTARGGQQSTVPGATQKATGFGIKPPAAPKRKKSPRDDNPSRPQDPKPAADTTAGKNNPKGQPVPPRPLRPYTTTPDMADYLKQALQMSSRQMLNYGSRAVRPANTPPANPSSVQPPQEATSTPALSHLDLMVDDMLNPSDNKQPAGVVDNVQAEEDTPTELQEQLDALLHNVPPSLADTVRALARETASTPDTVDVTDSTTTLTSSSQGTGSEDAPAAAPQRRQLDALADRLVADLSQWSSRGQPAASGDSRAQPATRGGSTTAQRRAQRLREATTPPPDSQQQQQQQQQPVAVVEPVVVPPGSEQPSQSAGKGAPASWMDMWQSGPAAAQPAEQFVQVAEVLDVADSSQRHTGPEPAAEDAVTPPEVPNELLEAALQGFAGPPATEAKLAGTASKPVEEHRPQPSSAPVARATAAGAPALPGPDAAGQAQLKQAAAVKQQPQSAVAAPQATATTVQERLTDTTLPLSAETPSHSQAEVSAGSVDAGGPSAQEYARAVARADLLQADNQHLQSQCQGLQEQLSQAQIQIQKLTRDNKELQDEVSAVLSEKRDLISGLMDERDEMRKLQQEIASLKQQLTATPASSAQPGQADAVAGGAVGAKAEEQRLLEVAAVANQMLTKVFSTSDLSAQSKMALSADITQILQLVLQK